MNASRIVIGIIAAVALAGGGFFAGVTVGGSSATASPSPADAGAGRQIIRQGQGQGQGGAGAQFGGAVTGRVISVNADSITVETRQPGPAGASPATTSTIVLVGGTTRLVRTTESDIKLADIKAGDNVTVVGQPDPATGTVAANAVVVGGNALQQLFGGGAAPLGSGRPATPRPSPTR